MESKMENKTTCLQNENTIPASQKKKSGIPVPVKKCVQTRRPVLATVSEFQQNVLLNNATTSHKPAQTVPAPKSNRLDKRVRDESSVSSNGCKDAARNPDAPSAQGCKSVFAAAASDVHFKTEQKTPKALTAVAGCTTEVSASKTPSNGPDKLVSLLEEQQQCGIEFQKDGNALKSILTNAGIAVTASGTVSDMFRPQRMTEGQGRPVYTPAKHAALMRNSVYTKEPRMSLIDSCNQYKKFLRQTRGQEEQSESASPLLAKSPRKIAVSESPLLRGMKSNTVRGSVYPKWSHPGLCSPFVEPKSTSRLELSKPGEVTNHADVPKEKLGTPKTPVMAFRRVPISPLSSRPRPVGGFVAGTPVTPLSAYSRVALTPAQRVPTQSSSKRDVKTEPSANPVQGSIKKKLRWADILSACSPDPQHTEQTEQRVPTSGSMTSIDSCTTHTSVFKPETEHRDPTSYRPMPTSAAKSAPQYPTPCTTVQNHKDSSPLVPPPHGTEHPLHPQQNPPFSIRVRDFSAPLFPVHEGEEGDGQFTDGRDGQRQRGAVCSSVHSSRDEWSSAYPGERGPVGNAHESLSASASQRDILARLQVLEEQEHGIRNEMWLLRMAMKKQREAANSHNKHKEDGGDNIAHPAPTQHQLRHSSTDHNVMMNQVSSFGDGASAFSTVGQGVRFELPQTGLWDCKSGSMPTQTSRMQTSHFSTSGSQGNTVSSTVYSEPSSYNYNIDSNVKTVQSEIVKNPLPNMPCDTAGLNLDTGGALPDIWPTWNMAIKLLEVGEFLWPHDVVASPVTDNRHVTELGNTGNDCEKVSAKDKEKAQHPSTDTMSSPASVSPNTSVLSMECEDMSSKKEEAPFEQSCPPVSDQKMYDAQLHTEQQELAPGTNTVQNDANSAQGYSTLFLNNQGLRYQTNSQSMDMDVEVTEDEATQELSPATKKQSESYLEGEPRALYSRPRISNPVSTIVQPRVMPSSPPQSMDIQISPPIWTTLALQSAAKHNSLQTSPVYREHQQVSAASQAQSTPTSHVQSAAILQAHSTPTSQAQRAAVSPAQSTPTLLPQSAVLLHTPTSQAQNTATSQTHPHHTSPLLLRGDHAIKTEKDSSSVNNRPSPVSQPTETCTKTTGSGSNTPVYRAYAPGHSLSRRSPLHGTLRPIKHGRVTSSALKNADVFLEALVEDECALYAGRLQSFFRNPQVVCDRQETSDPVAKILTEGDHMHFLPVSDDPTFGFRSTTAFENSAFFTYVPV